MHTLVQSDRSRCLPNAQNTQQRDHAKHAGDARSMSLLKG